VLTLADPDEEVGDEESGASEIVLRGERPALAAARFAAGLADLVVGGTAGDLVIPRQAQLPANAMQFEPVDGLFGLQFTSNSGPLADPAVRNALSMAVDREALVDELDVPNIEARFALLSEGNGEVAEPAQPSWRALPLLQRREQAAGIVAAAVEDQPLTVRVAMPELPGYRLVFAHLRRDWRAIGVEARRVGPREDADLRLVDAVAPTVQAAWYLRRFSCGASRVCVDEADDLLDSARTAPSAAERRQLLANADALLTAAAPFIPLTSPVRWTLVSTRLTGFQPNLFAQHFPGTLLAPRR
jgi:peptide/nickel transport system substrate-binding protein